MNAQKLLKEQVSFAVMPTPRVISSGCGISLRIAPIDADKAVVLLKEGQLPEEFYKLHTIAG